MGTGLGSNKPSSKRMASGETGVRYIFSVNAGRSGSDYACQLFQHAEGVCAKHEQMPVCNGQVMAAWNRGDEEPMRQLVQKKVSFIQKTLTDSGQKVFFDSNHCFIKGFGWELVGAGIPQEQIGVLVLRRPGNATALLRIHDIPGRLQLARDWLLSPSPDTVKNLKPAPHEEEASHLEVCEWYVEEIYRRGEAFKKAFPRVTFVDVTLDELNDCETVQQVFGAFGLSAKPSLSEVCGKPSNSRTAYPPLDEAMLARFNSKPKFPHPSTLSKEEQLTLVDRLVSWFCERYKEPLGQLPIGRVYDFPTRFSGVIALVQAHIDLLEEQAQTAVFCTDLESVVAFRCFEAHWPDDVFIAFIKMDMNQLVDISAGTNCNSEQVLQDQLPLGNKLEQR